MTTNCTFINNVAATDGGGVYHKDCAHPTMVNCAFLGNVAGTGDGGAMLNYWSYISWAIEVTLTNCLFSGNSAGDDGGGIYNREINSTLTNCTFGRNTATDHGGAMYILLSQGHETTINNSILWGSTPQQIALDAPSLYIYYSDLEGGIGGIVGGDTINYSDIIDEDPLFVDADGGDDVYGTADDNLRLSPGSPCIDTANNSAVPTGIETDLDGRDRFADGHCDTTIIVDMGAFELTYAYFGDFDSDCDVDFLDYAILAGFWLTDEFLVDIAPTPAGDGIVDISDLAVLCDNWLESF